MDSRKGQEGVTDELHLYPCSCDLGWFHVGDFLNLSSGRWLIFQPLEKIRLEIGEEVFIGRVVELRQDQREMRARVLFRTRPAMSWPNGDHKPPVTVYEITREPIIIETAEREEIQVPT